LVVLFNANQKGQIMTKTKTITLPVETKTLALTEVDGVAYVTLDAMAQVMQSAPDINFNRMQYRLHEVLPDMPEGWVVLLEQRCRVTRDMTVTALRLPAAIIMLARSKARDFTMMHDFLTRQLA